MTVAREHAVAGGRSWGTLSECYSRRSDGPSVVVPISQIEGMSDEEIAACIRGLVDEAKITGLFAWLDEWDHFCGFRIDDVDPKKLLVNLCMVLGYQDQHSKSRIHSLEENLRMMEILQHQNAEIRNALAEICKLLDKAYGFLANKPKLTPGQRRARSVILRLRDGCDLCGLLNGQHTERCLAVCKSAATV